MIHKRNTDGLELKPCDVLQVVQRLEADLGVKVQEVHFPELRYGFHIWSTYMGLSDKEGNVGPTKRRATGQKLTFY